MTVSGVTGPEKVSSSATGFKLLKFGLAVSRGSGGATTWTLGAAVTADEGAPDLYALAAAGTSIDKVTFLLDKTTQGTQTTGGIQIVASNVVIAGLSTDAIPSRGNGSVELELTLTFGDLSVGIFDGGTSPSRTLQISRPEPSAINSLTFSLGGSGLSDDVSIEGFTPPSQTSVGLHGFGDASLTFSSGVPGGPRGFASIIDVLAQVLQGAPITTLDVDLYDATSGSTPPPALTGNYELTNATFDSFSLLGSAFVTVTFGATAYSWTFGTDTQSFP